VRATRRESWHMVPECAPQRHRPSCAATTSHRLTGRFRPASDRFIEARPREASPQPKGSVQMRRAIQLVNERDVMGARTAGPTRLVDGGVSSIHAMDRNGRIGRRGVAFIHRVNSGPRCSASERSRRAYWGACSNGPAGEPKWQSCSLGEQDLQIGSLPRRDCSPGEHGSAQDQGNAPQRGSTPQHGNARCVLPPAAGVRLRQQPAASRGDRRSVTR
jgi:hypothetical protein